MTEKANLEVKLIQLQLAVTKTGRILDKSNKEAIERHLTTLKAISSEVEQHKRAVEAVKIGEKAELDEIAKWSSSVDEELDSADAKVAQIKQWLGEKNSRKRSR